MARQNPAEFTPPNVLMLNNENGVVPFDVGQLILQDVMSNSVMMQLAKYEEMSSSKKKFNVFLNGIGAYWVGEGQRIQTTKPTWGEITMESHKLGVILPTTREYLHYKAADYFEMMRPAIAEAFYKKFDMATILNVDNVYTQSVDQSANLGRAVEGEIGADSYFELTDLMSENGIVPNAFISRAANNTLLRNVLDPNPLQSPLYDRGSALLDGIPVMNFEAPPESFPKGTIYAGDFNYAYYGIPYGITYSISDQATISTILGDDGEPLNLWEREMVALRATMDVAFMIVKDDAFGKISAPIVEGP